MAVGLVCPLPLPPPRHPPGGDPAQHVLRVRHVDDGGLQPLVDRVEEVEDLPPEEAAAGARDGPAGPIRGDGRREDGSAAHQVGPVEDGVQGEEALPDRLEGARIAQVAAAHVLGGQDVGGLAGGGSGRPGPAPRGAADRGRGPGGIFMKVG